MCKFFAVIFFISVNIGLANAQTPDAPQPDAQKPGAQPKPDLSTPEAAVRSFVDALTLRNVEHALACVYRANTRNRTELVKQMQLREKTKARYSIVDLDIELDKRPHRALAFVKWKYERVDASSATPIGFQDEEILLLFRDGQDWKILSGDPSVIWTPAQGGSLQMAATQIAHPEVLEPAAQCQSKVSTIASQVMSYISRKYGGKLAVTEKAAELKADTPGAEKWSLLKRALVPEFNENTGPNPTRIFHCPADGDDIEKESYSFNEKLDGVAVTEIAEPANTVLLYEGKDGKLNFRHDCRASVAFVDGHMELINEEQSKTNEEQSKTLRWTP